MGSADEKNPVLMVLICCSTIFGIAGLILGAVSLSQKGAAQYNIYTDGGSTSTSSMSSDSGSTGDDYYSDDRVWMIAIGDYDTNVEYLDPVSYTIKGYNVDVIDAVCDIANKNCKLVWDIYENCWDSTPGERPRGGPGLMGNWYDACTGWVQSYDRLLTYDFTRPFEKQRPVAMFARSGSPINSSTDLGTLNKVGFLDGWATDELCLSRYTTITGSTLRADQIVYIQTPEALFDAVNNGDVDLLFAQDLPQFASLKRVSEANFENMCEVDGGSMMTRRNNREFTNWWDDAFSRLVGTSRYDTICKDIGIAHGGIDGGDYTDICIGY